MFALDYEPVLEATHPLVNINPDAVTLERIDQADIVHLQARASKAVWRPAPGRKTSYGAFHDGRLIGLLFLASPVINLGVRDQYLNLPTDGKGQALRQVADLSVCVGLQPLAWHWNIGKLIALLATSTTVAEHHHRTYGDPLHWITTTSLYGRGAQYNRIYKFLGYTKGYGHQHIPDADYTAMLAWMRRNNTPIPSSAFGAGSNPRMRRIAAYQRARGQTPNLHHGELRGVYIHPANTDTVTNITHAWYTRWGHPRYLRTQQQTPPYTTGLETPTA